MDACAYGIPAKFHLRPISNLLAEDARWGIATVRQRYLVHFPIVAQRMEQHVEALATTPRAIATRLHKLWPAATEELPV